MISLVMVMLGLGVSQAYAVDPTVPMINGLLGAGGDISEWDNQPPLYEYYLKVQDDNEAGITDRYDISDVVLLQELGNSDPDKNGVYFMLTTWEKPPSLIDVDQTAVRASLALFSDFGGDGAPTDPYGPFPADVQLYVTNLNVDLDPGIGVAPDDPVGKDRVYWCSGAAGSCDASNGTLIWNNGGATGDTPAGFKYARGADAIEMFLKTGTFGTPANVPFPQTNVGCATYDDGSENQDDHVCGSTFIPEPSTMFMALSGLLGLAGFGKFKFWN
ncbi:MAG: hypothetical protein HY584_02870 [Candidatus Omnitrophica bacterium]|nr:hypothetical protein [Candidatus Omnitrophota bacterium]